MLSRPRIAVHGYAPIVRNGFCCPSSHRFLEFDRQSWFTSKNGDAYKSPIPSALLRQVACFHGSLGRASTASVRRKIDITGPSNEKSGHGKKPLTTTGPQEHFFVLTYLFTRPPRLAFLSRRGPRHRPLAGSEDSVARGPPEGSGSIECQGERQQTHLLERLFFNLPHGSPCHLPDPGTHAEPQRISQQAVGEHDAAPQTHTESSEARTTLL